MEAGFARIRITPPPGTPMIGWTQRDDGRGCTGVDDDLYARALYLADGGEEALIVGLDLLFFSRAEADRYRGAIGRRTRLAPRQILLNTSHTHTGPQVGSWAFAPFVMPAASYLDDLEQDLLWVAEEARARAVEVTLWAGMGHTALPLNRRRLDPSGRALFEPNPGGATCNLLPLCLLRDLAGEPVSLLFSVACHPSTLGSPRISADYPGAAMAALDRYLGKECSLFLQGCGGDSKIPQVAVNGRWVTGTYAMAVEAGESVAREVIACLESGLAPVEPELRSAETETLWPLQTLPTGEALQALAGAPETEELQRTVTRRRLEQLAHGRPLPTAAPVTLQGIQLGRGLRLVGLEGEPVAELGLLMHRFYGQGVTFPLGYTNGTQLYLVTSPMVDEVGYEVYSYFQYGYPAPLAKGTEDVVRAGLERLAAAGVR